MTRRHPDDALVSNLKDTAPPTGRYGEQSQRHGATRTTPRKAIPMTAPPATPWSATQRRAVTNPNDTATQTRPAQQSP